jgi:signal transduction histidine kinase
MATYSQFYFPPLRRKILQNFLVVIVAYGLLGFLLIGAVFFASSFTPKVIHVNYDSISAANHMREAWWALHHPQDLSEISTSDWVNTFEKEIKFEEGNITEIGEAEIARNIRGLWNSVKKDPSKITPEQFSQMLLFLDQLVAVNERGMFSLASKSHQFGQKIFLGVLVFFLMAVVLSIFLADNLSNRLATPIKEIAEILRSKPDLHRRLHLPEPTTLEISILNRELTGLWDQLGALAKLNLDQLVTQRNQLETVLASVEDGILVLNNEEKVVLCNEGMAQILGIELKDILHNSWRDLPTLNENYLKLRDFLVPELSSFNSVELNLEGIKMILAARYRPIFGEENRQKGSLYLLHDITQKVQKERLKEEFISVLSHELKTPLQSLGTAVELLANRKEKMDENIQILFDTLSEDVSRIRAIANDFIQVGQREIHTLKLRMKKTPLNQRLAEWIKPFRVLAKDRNIEIEFHVEGPGTVWANLDEIKFPWVISNLLSNAIRISPPEAKVEIALSAKDKKIELTVADEGPGIPEKVQKRIFEPYYQGPEISGSTTSGFLGIGLTIAKEVVEAHEGKIEYQRREPKGSIFKIQLPLAS